jgi:hypothetical protein
MPADEGERPLRRRAHAREMKRTAIVVNVAPFVPFEHTLAPPAVETR